MTLYARVASLDQGHKYDVDQMQAAKFSIGDIIEVAKVDMGGSYTSITLEGLPGRFNSVNFDFLEDDKEIDIYSDKRFFDQKSYFLQND